jgi:hypothetical protein
MIPWAWLLERERDLMQRRVWLIPGSRYPKPRHRSEMGHLSIEDLSNLLFSAGFLLGSLPVASNSD